MMMVMMMGMLLSNSDGLMGEDFFEFLYFKCWKYTSSQANNQ